ncbi:MAG: hypothetical protein Q4P71_01960 [Actinomycetaceae bacterium]|nr:hypothetical protein [Actinomycetaceae bacterium]
MKSTLRPLTIAALVCSLSLPLSACGGSNSASENGGEPSTDTSATATSTTTENEPTEAPESSVENVLASMSPDEIEAKLATVSVDGKPLTISLSHQELTEMAQTLGDSFEEMLESMTVEPAECLNMAQEAQKMQKLSNIEFAVAANTADNQISVFVQKVDFDMSASIDNIITYATTCPDVSIELPGLGLKSQVSQTATSSHIPPLNSGVILTQEQKTGDINSSTYTYYGADPESGLFVLVNAPVTSPSTDVFEALVTDVINQLNTR